MKIVVAPDSFKESLSAAAAAESIRIGFSRVIPRAAYDLVPMADGGEGTVDAMVHATGGRFVTEQVRGPLGGAVEARYGILGDGRTAVIEMAAASGLPLVRREDRNPMITTTFGTGELIKSGLDQGVSRIVIGIGGSATNDGGAGAMQALGARLLDASGRPVGPGGQGLKDLARIDVSGFDGRVAATDIRVACDVDNPLTGARGASAVYGPQKGATKQMVGVLDENLAHCAEVIGRDLGIDVDGVPGAGAAGGLGAGLLAFCGAVLESGSHLVADAVGLDRRMQDADLCVTGEGQIDGSSRFGKVCHHVAELAGRYDIPVIALAGSIGPQADTTIPPLTAFFSIVNRPMDIHKALNSADVLLAQLAEQVARVVQAGRKHP